MVAWVLSALEALLVVGQGRKMEEASRMCG